MRPEAKIIVLAVLPLVAAVLVIAVLVGLQSRELARLETTLLEESMLAAKRTELRHYVQLAQTSIAHIDEAADNGLDDALAREAKRILSSMSFGDDGYFFAYDRQGNNLVHPREPQLVGTNLWDVRDPNGVPVIQRLLAAAPVRRRLPAMSGTSPRPGNPPTSSATCRNPRWGWMFGTGIYLDDVAAGTQKIREQTAANITSIMLGLAVVAVVGIARRLAGGLALNVSEHRLADQQLKLLAQRLVSSQEEERARVSRELHDGLSQLLVSTKFRFELAQERLQSGCGDASQAIDEGINGLSGRLPKSVASPTHCARRCSTTSACRQRSNSWPRISVAAPVSSSIPRSARCRRLPPAAPPPALPGRAGSTDQRRAARPRDAGRAHA